MAQMLPIDRGSRYSAIFNATKRRRRVGVLFGGHRIKDLHARWCGVERTKLKYDAYVIVKFMICLLKNRSIKSLCHFCCPRGGCQLNRANGTKTFLLLSRMKVISINHINLNFKVILKSQGQMVLCVLSV